MDILLSNYIHTLLVNKINLSNPRRNIVVILSKADLIPQLPNDLRLYLVNDPLRAALSSEGKLEPLDSNKMSHYMKELANISNIIADWLLSRDAGASGFIAMAKANNIHVRFSIISSLGGVDITTGLADDIFPLRVLDPFFWAMDFEKTTSF